MIKQQIRSGTGEGGSWKADCFNFNIMFCVSVCCFWFTSEWLKMSGLEKEEGGSDSIDEDLSDEPEPSNIK